jgi:predicted DNA-binding ribbon-helix-helix protein
MCQIFINADPALYATRSRSLRVHGVSTSIRLENMFWSVLEEIGRRDGMTVNQLIAKLYNELIEAGLDGANFTSFLRVCCTRYLSLQLAGRIPADLSVPIRSLDPAWVLAGERRTTQAPARTCETSSSRRSSLRSSSVRAG